MGGKYYTGDSGKDSNLAYDDSAFQLFAVAILAVYWIPTALFRIARLIYRARHVKTPLEEAKEAWCVCSLCQHKAEKINASRRGARSFPIYDIIFILVTIWLVFMSFKVYQANLKAEPPFDPFVILGVPETASDKEIKKAYRRMSVLHHPDKNRNDPTAADRFIRISKAFEALTKPDAKENYRKYGNPDGYMGTTMGLGLPEWLSESGNIVLFVYFTFIVLVFPLIVGIWWRQRSQQLTSELLAKTFKVYGETLNQSMRFRDLLAAFASSYEFEHLYSSENSELIADVNDTLKRAGKTEVRKTKCFIETEPFQVHNLYLLTAYLARLPIPEKLQYVVDGMLERSEPLLTALTDTAGVFQRPDTRAAWYKNNIRGDTAQLITCISLTQCLNQALDERVSPFMQLPHCTEREAKFCSGPRSSRSIYDFMKLDVSEQRNILRGFTDEQFLDVKAFCDRFPSANLEVSDPYVEGEEDSTVHEGDAVTIRVRLTVMRRAGSAFSPHVPRLSFRKEEVWWLWLSDQRLRCPIGVRRLLPKMARGHDPERRRRRDEEEYEPWPGEKEADLERLCADMRVTVFDVKFQFAAPRAGVYNMEVTTACDCYMGSSKCKMLKMQVLSAVEEAEESSVRYFDTDDETESEEEESSEEEETEGEYEYIEVDDSGEEGDFEDGEESSDDDFFGMSGEASGDPAAR